MPNSYQYYKDKIAELEGIIKLLNEKREDAKCDAAIAYLVDTADTLVKAANVVIQMRYSDPR
jgi:hypothetical protein